MSITDELRKYVSDWRKAPRLMECLDAGDVNGILQDFLYIADRIDAEHKAALEKVAAMVDMSEEYADSIIAANSLEKRVERIERLLSHKGGAE